MNHINDNLYTEKQLSLKYSDYGSTFNDILKFNTELL